MRLVFKTDIRYRIYEYLNSAPEGRFVNYVQLNREETKEFLKEVVIPFGPLDPDKEYYAIRDNRVRIFKE